MTHIQQKPAVAVLGTRHHFSGINLLCHFASLLRSMTQSPSLLPLITQFGSSSSSLSSLSSAFLHLLFSLRAKKTYLFHKSFYSHSQRTDVSRSRTYFTNYLLIFLICFIFYHIKYSILNIKIMRTCCARWLKGLFLVDFVNLIVYMCRVELFSFFSISFVVFLLVLFAYATILCGE